jgi:hypothetical protein
MRACWSALTCLFLIFSLLSCKEMHARPPNVPSSAVWVDNTFVDCSTDTQSDANRCTVYKDDNGEILADGLFVLSSSHAAATKSDLQYVAFGDQGIYLQDARILLHVAPSQRDPSYRTIDARLKTLASNGGIEAVNCSDADSARPSDARADCAIKAFASRRPFYVRYYSQYQNSFGYKGYAGDADGNVFFVDYHSGHDFEIGDRSGKEFDDNHSLVSPCPKPTALGKMKDGRLVCVIPATRLLPPLL